MEYTENIFSRIIKGEVPCKKIFEDETVIAFYDIHPKARIHALVLPKLEYATFEDFILSETKDVISNLFIKANFIATEILGLKGNFRLMINNGKQSGQEIFHLHIHILSN